MLMVSRVHETLYRSKASKRGSRVSGDRHYLALLFRRTNFILLNYYLC